MKAEELKKLRKKRGFTQKELANLCGMHPQTIKGYEGGLQKISSTKAELFYHFLNNENINIPNEVSIDYNNPDKIDIMLKMIRKLNEDIEILKLSINSQTKTDKKSTNII